MDSTPESREAATNGYKTYLRGLTRQQVFTPLNGKAAYLPEWQKNPVRLKEVPEGKNVGLLLEHAGLTDVDLDCAEVQYTVPVFLDSDTLGVGRGGKIRRYLYEGAADRIYTDLDNTTKLLEVRHKAKQFMCPPSIHPDTGEPVEWIKGMPPIPLPDEETIHKAATSALIARHLPAGGRHDLAMAYAGFLLRKGLQEQEVFDILWTAWELSNPSRDADRDLWNIVKDTAEKIAQDKPATGGNTLTRMIPGMTDKISEYWGWDQLLTHEEKIEQERQERIQRARDAWPKCEGLAHDSDILSNIYNLIKADGLIGEETNAKLLTLGAVSLLRGEPISAIVKGTSSVGKSEVIKRATKALPPEMIVERQAMSERALAYMGKDRLKSKILVVYELGGSGQRAKSPLRWQSRSLARAA